MNDNCLLVLKRINEGKTFKEIMDEDHLNNLELLSSIKKLLKKRKLVKGKKFQSDVQKGRRWWGVATGRNVSSCARGS